MNVVEEKPLHRKAIKRVIADAFGRADEARLVNDLRRDGDLVLSLVWQEEGKICGHVALSRLRSPERALALAPISVLTARQREGIGSALVRRANARAQELGYDIVFVLGHPAYYLRLGFSAQEAARFPCAHAGPHFMALRLTERAVPPVPVIYPSAFAHLG